MCSSASRHHSPDLPRMGRKALPEVQGCLRASDPDIAPRSTAGPGPRWAPGVGIASMRERAAEVGGTLTAEPTPTGGLVHARLPTTSQPSAAEPQAIESR
jgi:hypothetical protein